MSQQDKDFIDSLFRAQRKYLKQSEAKANFEINATGGAVPTPPDTVLGPTFLRVHGIEHMGLDSTEEAAQGSEIRWDGRS